MIELTRSATQSEKVRDRILADNRKREAERKAIVTDFNLQSLSPNQQKALSRVFCSAGINMESASIPDWIRMKDARITEKMAAEGKDVEVDHIVPD